ncbi:MAG: L-threonylcarbamoyladenylate synthase [Anaerolineae bacterium]|jgi:L-threonylcarbamoyladenylate synthase|nr:L-threonylcarbamoyladenylate synthase [Anaerolineae bacterium]
MPIRSQEAVAQAAVLMRAGRLVIVPTDTIYGIASTLADEATVQRLYEARGREPEPALPLLIANESDMARLTRPSTAAWRLAHRFWPGPLTLILPPAADLPAYARATPIAVRVPDFPALMPLLAAVGGYMLVSGAIRPGYPPAITAQEAGVLFTADVSLLLDGGTCPYGLPSTIVDCVPDTPVVVRRGAIPEPRIWRALDAKHGPESAQYGR